MRRFTLSAHGLSAGFQPANSSADYVQLTARITAPPCLLYAKAVPAILANDCAGERGPIASASLPDGALRVSEGQRKDSQWDDAESTASDSEVSGQPIRERLHELRHTSVIGFLEHLLVYRRSVISCGRPHGPLYAPNHCDAANVVPSRAVLDWPQNDIVYAYDQRAALRRHAGRQGLDKLIG
jgi:hypothetical protein